MLLFSHYFVSNSATPGTQHTRLLCPSIPPAICSNSCPLSRWCHPAISSSVAPFSFCPQSLPATGSFPVNWLFAWGGQITAASTSATVLPMKFKTDFLEEGLVQSSYSPRVSQESSPAQFESLNFSALSLLYVQLSHLYTITGKIIALTRQTFVGKVMSLLSNTLSRFVIAFLPRSKCLLISRLQSQSAVDFGAQENKICHHFQCKN